MRAKMQGLMNGPGCHHSAPNGIPDCSEHTDGRPLCCPAKGKRGGPVGRIRRHCLTPAARLRRQGISYEDTPCFAAHAPGMHATTDRRCITRHRDLAPSSALARL